MRDEIVNVLLEIGIPASVKGFTYIIDAMEFFESDPYYSDGKICALYSAIAKKRNTTQSRVERAIRHAFEKAVTRGNHEMVGKYLDFDHTQNSNLLRTLHLRLKQEEKKKNPGEALCSRECEMKQQIYVEMIKQLTGELEAALRNLAEPLEGTRADGQAVWNGHPW